MSKSPKKILTEACKVLDKYCISSENLFFMRDSCGQINGEQDGVKRALVAISSIMYKFSPKEQISLETSVTEAPPSIIIPSDVPMYPPGGIYSSTDTILPPRSLPPIFGSGHLQDLQGYADAGNPWSLYPSALSVVPGYGSASRAEELIMRVLCPFDKIGRVIGRGGGTIKSIRQASGARVDVDDTKEDRDECIITVISAEVFLSISYPGYNCSLSPF